MEETCIRCAPLGEHFDPRDGDLQQRIGLAAELGGGDDLARRHLEPLAYKTSAVILSLARIALRQARSDEAHGLLRSVLQERRPEAFELDLAIARRSGDPAQIQAAERARDRILGSQRLVEQAVKQQIVGEREAATASYRAALAIDDRTAVAHSNLGYIYFDERDPSAALREHERAITIDPTYPEARNGSALALKTCP